MKLNNINNSRLESNLQTTKHSSSMKLLPKIDSTNMNNKLRNHHNDHQFINQSQQQHTPIGITSKKQSITLLDQIGIQQFKQPFQSQQPFHLSSQSQMQSQQYQSQHQQIQQQQQLQFQTQSQQYISTQQLLQQQYILNQNELLSNNNNHSNNAYQFPIKKQSQQKIDSIQSEETKVENNNDLKNNSQLTKSQIRFKPASQTKILRNSSEILDNMSQASMSTIQNSQSPASIILKQDLRKTMLFSGNVTSTNGNTLNQIEPNLVLKPTGLLKSPQNTITQLQIDADQNRLDFMLEKGINFEKNTQLIKLKQDNYELKKDNKKQEIEIKKLKNEIEMLKQQINKLNQNILEKPPQIQDETYSFLEKKFQQNDYFKQQLNNQKITHEKEIIQFQETISNMTNSLKEATELIQKYQSHVCQDNSVIIQQLPQKIIPTDECNKNQECKDCISKNDQINSQNIQILALQSDLTTYKAQNENLVLESQSLRDYQVKQNNSFNNEKSSYEKYIQEQSDEILKVDKELRDYKRLYEEMNDRIKQIKNGNDFTKIQLRNEYVLLKTEIVDNLERLSKERLDRINENIIQLQQLNNKYDDEKIKSNKLTEEVNQLNQHLDWLKKRGGQMSKQNGTFNYIGLSDEILQLKKVIDNHITSIPNNHDLTTKVEEMNLLNSQMVEKINRIQSNEEKTRKTIESVPILKQFEQAQLKVEQHLVCAGCNDIINEAITCVPCGHNYCKKCHYEKDNFIKTNDILNSYNPNNYINNNNNNSIEQNTIPDAAISCMKCGPSTMIYRNESLDEIIEMYHIMKSSKEVMKAYLSQQ